MIRDKMSKISLKCLTLSSFKIPTMEDDIREDEEWCYQCRYICCDTIFRQKWKFDRHISSW